MKCLHEEACTGVCAHMHSDASCVLGGGAETSAMVSKDNFKTVIELKFHYFKVS